MTRFLRGPRLWGSLAALLSLGAGGVAHAQSATPLERWQPTPIGDALFAAPSAGVDAHFAFDAGLRFSYADSPLALRQKSGAGTYTDLGAIVAQQSVLHAQLAVSLASRLKIEADLPVTVAQSGDSPKVNGVAIASPSGAALNDLRVGARFTALPQGRAWPSIALSPSAWIPTGDPGAYTSTGSARFEPRIVIGADYGPIVWSASVGRQLGDPTVGLLGSEVTFAGGVAARIDRFQIGPELFGSALVDREAGAASGGKGVALSDRAGASLEALLGAKAHFGPLTVGAAFGLGFLRGPGTPDLRAIGEVAIRPFEVKKAPAGWSLFGDDDARTTGATVAAAKPVDSGAKPIATKPAAPPPPDTDGDTVIDAEDACPRVVGDPSPSAKRRGCPPDRDGDGIVDADDRCPDRPGVAADGDKNGCPPDSDGDGIVDPDDACPAEAGPKSEDPKENGCPKSVRVVGSQIVILQQVNFETAKSRILPDSFPLLQQVADVLAQHPEIARLAVDGHTDNRGSEASNLDLSRARAVSVMRWLTEKGVDARRLEARGFGPRRPIAPNTTNEGRAKNRRVEFQIRKRTDKGEAGWVDGPVDAD
ncbi:MAG: OmpA family protein [Polyangiaceae bacterium]